INSPSPRTPSTSTSRILWTSWEPRIAHMRSPLRFVAASCRSEAVAVAVALELLIAVCPAFAVDPAQPFCRYIRTHFTPDDGLPAGIVDNIQQTPDGFLWMVVNGNGLTRFD